MTATPLSAATRHLGLKYIDVYWVPTIANKAAPTRSELNAGTSLGGEIPDDGIEGFTIDADKVEANDIDTGFTATLKGRETVPDSSLKFYRSADSDDVRTLLPVDESGYIVVFPEKDVAGHTMDVFPVRVNSAPKGYGGNDPAWITVNFVITSRPETDVTVPA